MTTRTKRRLGWTTAVLAGLAVIGVVGVQVLIGSVMRQLTNGRLEGGANVGRDHLYTTVRAAVESRDVPGTG